MLLLFTFTIEAKYCTIDTHKKKKEERQYSCLFFSLLSCDVLLCMYCVQIHVFERERREAVMLLFLFRLEFMLFGGEEGILDIMYRSRPRIRLYGGGIVTQSAMNFRHTARCTLTEYISRAREEEVRWSSSTE